MPDTLHPLSGRDAASATLRTARFTFYSALAEYGTRLAPIARPPWSTGRDTVAANAYTTLDYLDGLAGAAARDVGSSPSEFAELLDGARHVLDGATLAAGYQYLAALRAVA